MLSLIFSAYLAATNGVQPTISPLAPWLGNEASYLVTEQEREEFRELTTDSARQSFVRQFWLRRGSEFREEFNRRVAFANAQFSISGPGWESDRGRAYVILGEPSEIEAYPTQKAEVWRYKELELRFSGLTPDGDYSLILPKPPARSEVMGRLRLTTVPQE